MADSFFEFNTSLTGLELVDEPELDEEEYDALNDETFGADAFQGDWEEDHTRFAEVTENSRIYRNSFNSEKDNELDLEASLSQLVMEGEEEEGEDEVHCGSKNQKAKSNSISNRLSFDYISGYSSSPAWRIDSSEKASRLYNKQQHQEIHKSQTSEPLLQKHSVNHFLPPQLPRIPTVQELERDLMVKNKDNKCIDKENKCKGVNQSISQEKNNLLTVSNNSNFQYSSNQFQNVMVQQQNVHSKFSHSAGGNLFPPGFGSSQQSRFSQPQQQEMVLLRNNQNLPVPLVPLLLPPPLPMLLSSHILPSPSPHPLLSQNSQMVNNHPMMRFMSNRPLLMQQQHIQQQQNHQKQIQNKMQNNQEHMRNGQASRNHHNGSHSQHPWLFNPNRRGNGNHDEYAGLMNNRERQWLLNIQIIQLAMDKPHVDDYYYMVWLKKQEKEKKLKEETRNGLKNEKLNREPFFANNRQPKNETNHRERRDSEREINATPSPRVYVPLQFENSLGKLQCGSVIAPRKIFDLDVVPERQFEVAPSTSHRDSRKTKKILLELEKLILLAMEIEEIDNNILPEVSQSAEEPPPSKSKLLEQIMTSYLNEDRFVNFMCIRKGKTLMLRILPYLSNADQFEYLTNFWCRLFKSVSIIVRRDQNDGILILLYPYFKTWISTVDCTILFIIASYLITTNVPIHGKKTSRAVSPSSGKSVLSYILTTTFGVSVVSSILSRGETIYPTLEEKEKLDWTKFILNFIKHLINSPNLENHIPTPLDPLPANVFTVILNRSTGLNIQDYATAKRILTAFNKDKSRS